jgi:hypothetical protein
MPDPGVPGGRGATLDLHCGETLPVNDLDMGQREFQCACGDRHADNASAFADFMSNHYARPVESATSDEVAEFLDEYYPRNVWPTERQRAIVKESIDLVFEAADE